MAGGVYGLSDKDVRTLKNIRKWYDRNKNMFGNTFRRNPRITGGGDSSIRRAKLTADAGATATITANLYSTAGIEQTTGDEAGVTVYFRVHPAANMNAALPLLSSGEEINVVKLPYLNGETLEYRWYCTSDFWAADICE